MKAFFNVKMALHLLLVVGLFTSFGCGVEKVELDELIDQQESFATTRAENFTITGFVNDPITQEPIEGAIVFIGDDSTMTNERGYFSIRMEETGLGALVTVKKEGRFDVKFPVDFSNYPDNSLVRWSIDQPEKRDFISFTPGEEQTKTFMFYGVDDTTSYTVTVPADAADVPLDICVGPTGTVLGPGISGNFAVAGINIATPEFAYELDDELLIQYDPIKMAQVGGFGSLSPKLLSPEGQLLPEVREGAKITATSQMAALEAAEAILEAGGSLAEATAIFIEMFYDDAPELSVDEAGNLVICGPIEGDYYPGNGVFTEEDLIQTIGDNCEPIEGEERDIMNPDGTVIIVPHQATADGNG